MADPRFFPFHPNKERNRAKSRLGKTSLHENLTASLRRELCLLRWSFLRLHIVVVSVYQMFSLPKTRILELLWGCLGDKPIAMILVEADIRISYTHIISGKLWVGIDSQKIIIIIMGPALGKSLLSYWMRRKWYSMVSGYIRLVKLVKTSKHQQNSGLRGGSGPSRELWNGPETVIGPYCSIRSRGSIFHILTCTP